MSWYANLSQSARDIILRMEKSLINTITLVIVITSVAIHCLRYDGIKEPLLLSRDVLVYRPQKHLYYFLRGGNLHNLLYSLWSLSK